MTLHLPKSLAKIRGKLKIDKNLNFYVSKLEKGVTLFMGINVLVNANYGNMLSWQGIENPFN